MSGSYSKFFAVVAVVLLAGCAGAGSTTAQSHTPTETPTPTSMEKNITEVSYAENVDKQGGDLTLVYDSERDVYCYVYSVRESNKLGTLGGLSCIPVNQTSVPEGQR